MANINNEPGVIQMAALNRPFQLGTLYDCCTDTIGSNLWDRDKLTEQMHSKIMDKEEFKFHASDTISEKANALNVNPGMKLSLMNKLVETDGSSKFFDDRVMSAQKRRVTLSYYYTKRVENLNMKALKDDDSPNSYGTATHVVTGISFGGKAFFLFEKNVSAERELCNSWHNIIESIPFTEIDNGGMVYLPEEQKAEMTALSVSYYGDFALPQNPASYEEVVHLWKMLPNLLGKDVPLTVWLSPLSHLDNQANKFVGELSTYIVNSVEKAEEDFRQFEICCNDIKNSTIAKSKYICGLEDQISKLQNHLSNYRVKVQTELATATLKVRMGEIEEKEILLILGRKEKSPFCSNLVSKWLYNKKSEVKVIQQCFEEVQGIHFVPPDAFIPDPNVQHICLKLQQVRNDSLLSAMETYLTDGSDRNKLPAVHDQRLVDESIRNVLMKNLKLFITYYHTNKSNMSVKYLIMEEILDKANTECIVCCYKNGNVIVLENYDKDVIEQGIAGQAQDTQHLKTLYASPEQQPHSRNMLNGPHTVPTCGIGSPQLLPPSNNLYGCPPPYEPSYSTVSATVNTANQQHLLSARSPTSCASNEGVTKKLKFQQPQTQTVSQQAPMGASAFDSQPPPPLALFNNVNQVQQISSGYEQAHMGGASGLGQNLEPLGVNNAANQSQVQNFCGHRVSNMTTPGYGQFSQQPLRLMNSGNQEQVATSNAFQQINMGASGFRPPVQQSNMSYSYLNPWQMQYDYDAYTRYRPPCQQCLPMGAPPPWMPWMVPGYGIPSQPSVPYLSQKEHDSIALKWEKAASKENISKYEIFYEEIGGSEQSIKTREKCQEYIVDNLHPGSQYKFKIRAVVEAGGRSEFSDSTENIATLPASPPGKPKARKVSIHKASLKWEKPKHTGKKVSIETCTYVIKVYTDVSDKWCELYRVEATDTEAEFPIKPNFAYKFKVYVDCGNIGESKESPESDELNNAVSGLALVKAKTKVEANLLHDSEPSVFHIIAKKTYCNEQKKIHNFELGKENKVQVKPEKVILVVGATGSGKTTLINGMVNYIFDINWTDNCRVKLIVETAEGKTANQAVSQTSGISSYTIHHRDGLKIPFTLTIIDTPGFGDTSGILRDKAITEQIREFFANPDQGGIDHLDAVGFVAQASLPRLTPTQKYIFDSILSLFGKDIAGNIFMLLTFADGQKTPVLDGLKEANMPYQKCFKFNNSALFVDNTNNYLSKSDSEEDDDTDDDEEEDNFDEMFWKMGTKSFKLFLDSLSKCESKSLALTRDVLNERNRLEVSIQGIQQDIQIGLNKLEQLQKEVQVLKAHEADIDKNKDFEYTVNEETAELIPIPAGTYTTNCLVCKRTCHYPCGIKEDGDKSGCWAMTGGYCRICPANCYWDIHKNLPHKYEIKRVPVKKTAADLKSRYEEAQGKQLTAQQLIKNVLNEFEEIQVKVIGLTETVRLSLKRLKEIALKPSPLSTTEYIDILIESERGESKPGWKERVDQLQQVRKQAEYMKQLADQGYDPFEKYRENIKEAKKKKKSFLSSATKMFNPSNWFK